MASKVTIPTCMFTDRRIKPNHIRVFAALALHRGKSPMPPRDVARETGIDRSDVYRAINDLVGYGLYDEVSGQVRFIDALGEIPIGENPTEGKPPSATLSPDVPLSLSPKPLEPLPPLIPHSPNDGGARATRLPQDWKPDEGDEAYAKGIGLRDLPRHVEDFRDYWHARAGPDARKVSWPKTWRRWCRTAKERQDQADERQRRSNGKRHGGPASAYFEGSAMLIADIERGAQQPPDFGADFDPSQPLLDG